MNLPQIKSWPFICCVDWPVVVRGRLGAGFAQPKANPENIGDKEGPQYVKYTFISQVRQATEAKVCHKYAELFKIHSCYTQMHRFHFPPWQRWTSL